MKKCSYCKKEKNFNEFGNSRNRPDGLNIYCKQCANRKCREYRINNPERWELQRNKNFHKWRAKLNIDVSIKLRKNAGEGYVSKDGYLSYGIKNHPCGDKNNRVQASHLVYYEKTGYILKKGESIHHKNGDKLDNRFENLELCTTNHPKGQRVEDKIIWCIEFLQEWGYDVIKK